MPGVTLRPSIGLAAATLSRPAITLLPLSLLTNHQRQQRCVRVRGGVGLGLGGPTPTTRARLGLMAHDKPPFTTPIKPSPFSSSSSSIFPPASVGRPSSFNTAPPFRVFSFSSAAAASSKGGDSDSGSGSGSDPVEGDNMGFDHSQNGDGSPPLSRLEQEEKEKYARLLTLPTVLTLARVAAVPAFVSTFYVNSGWGPTTTTSIFIAAAITDWLDGYLARKMKLGTAFGAFLDPVADKLMVAATLILFCSRPLEVPIFGDAAWLFPVPSIAIIGREITMSAVREWAASQKGNLSEAVAVNNLGKWKTATQMISLTILLACRDSSFGRADILVASGVVLLYISAWLAVWSLVVYMRKIWKVLLK